VKLSALVIGATLVAVMACSPDKGFKTRTVTADDYGDAWPLTVERAVIACEPGDVPTVTVDGRTFRLDDETPETAEPQLCRIWADSSAEKNGKKDMTVLREDALALCD
jgi:hypothetical protein